MTGNVSNTTSDVGKVVDVKDASAIVNAGVVGTSDGTDALSSIDVDAKGSLSIAVENHSGDDFKGTEPAVDVEKRREEPTALRGDGNKEPSGDNRNRAGAWDCDLPDGAPEWDHFLDCGPWRDANGNEASDGTRIAICKAELLKNPPLPAVQAVRSSQDRLRAHLIVCSSVSNEVLRIMGGDDIKPGENANDDEDDTSSSDSGESSSAKDPADELEVIEVESDGRERGGDRIGAPCNMGHLDFPIQVLFTKPRAVEVVSLPPTAGVQLMPGEVLVQAEVSAVSAGTEMLVYRGNMPADIPTDENLTGASGEQASKPFQYPSQYGYALVGRVVAVSTSSLEHKKRRLDEGSPETCSDTDIKVGTRVFAFREHASYFVAAESDLMVVPDNVSVKDAAFLPNMETAVSLAMDAAPLPGENVAVVGQGIVGLLLVTVLKLCYGRTRVTAIDTRADRLEIASSDAGADAAVQVNVAASPGSQFEAGLQQALPEGDKSGVDVAIDVSGTGAGLDTAIRATRNGGRVVIGSWFGSNEVALSCLGGRFHRSHISLVASQVSSIPVQLTSRWTKSRRFKLAWELVRDAKPASRFPITVRPATTAPSVYAEIDRGEHLQVLFTYS